MCGNTIPERYPLLVSNKVCFEEWCGIAGVLECRKKGSVSCSCRFALRPISRKSR